MFIKYLRLGTVLATTVMIISGCLYTVVSVDQPTDVAEGAEFQVEIEIEYTDDTEDDGVTYAPAIAIMMPYSFTVNSGTYDAGAEGSGDLMDATSEMDDPDYKDHHLPPDYGWSKWRAGEQTFLPTGDMTVYTVTYNLNVTAYVITRGGYTMSYVGGTYN